MSLCCYTCVLVVVEVISRIEADLLVCVVFPPCRKLRNLSNLNFIGKILNCELISPAGAVVPRSQSGSAAGEFDFGLS